MANYYTSFSVLLPVGAGNIEAALALYAQFEQELEADDQSVGFLAEQDTPNSDAVWLRDDGGEGDPEHVIAYAFRCAQAFGLTGRWGFDWSLSCSRPILDGSGGGAQLLDLGRGESVSWIDTKHWLNEKLSAGEACAASAETILQRTIEAQGWNDHSQALMLRGFIDSLIAADPSVADQLRSHLATISGEQDGMLCRECGEPVFIANSGTSHHVGRGLDGIDYGRDRDHAAVADTGLPASGTRQEHAP